MNIKNIWLPVYIALTLFIAVGCSQESGKEGSSENASQSQKSPSDTLNPMNYKGVGPVTSVNIGPLDQTMAEQGKTLFETNCTACHRFDSKAIGPALKGVTKRRTPEWIMNMILNPMEMTQKDPIGRQLLEEYKAQMNPTNLSQEDARAVLEYLRSVDAKE